jgi:hypothetical protein
MFWWIFGWKVAFVPQEATFVVVGATTAKQVLDACGVYFCGHRRDYGQTDIR